MKVIVIGGNAAGMSAASRMMRKGDPELSVTVYEKTGEVSYGACGLPYYIGGENDDIDLVRIRTPQAFMDAGIDLRMGHTVLSVDADRKTVQVRDADGAVHTDMYDRLLVASGASPVRLPVPGAELDGIFTLKTIGDAQRIRNRLTAGETRRIALIGGGYIGLELAEAFARQPGKELRLIEAADRLIPGFDPEFSEAARAALERHGAAVHTGEKVRAFTGVGQVSGVETDRGFYEADLVVVAAGVRPNTDFLRDTGVEMLPNGAVVVDDAMRSGCADIFAAGDCATVIHRITGEAVYVPLGTNANKQGRLAGDSVLGKPVALRRALGTSMLRCLDVELAKTGLTLAEAERHGIPAKSATIKAGSHARYYPGATPVTVKLCYRSDNQVVIGAQVMGKQEAAWRVDVFACAVDRGMTAEELGYLDLGYAPPYSSVWDVIQVAANAVKQPE